MISVVGITVSTAALVILLSAFNGIEDMVVKLYSDFDAPLTIRSKQSKTFNQNFLSLDEIQQIEGVSYVMRAVEEVVILKKDKKWVHAKMIGVDTSFLRSAKINEHMVDGEPLLLDKTGRSYALFGASLLDKLDGYIPFSDGMEEQITFYVPLREGKMRPGKNPLSVERVPVSGRINYNREVNSEHVVVPYDLAARLLQYKDDVTAFYLAVDPFIDLNDLKNRVQSIVGEDFLVQTYLEKNQLIFKTSQTEKIIVFFILVFIFILASFNLIASITMLFVEKRADIKLLYNIGAQRKDIFKIFFYKGLMISFRGVLFGLLIGYTVAFSQLYFGFIQMPGAPSDFFPVKMTWGDGLFILAAVSSLGFIVSYLPTRLLVYKKDKT
jgi:lipoprotein-releasing system permease protein